MVVGYRGTVELGVAIVSLGDIPLTVSSHLALYLSERLLHLSRSDTPVAFGRPLDGEGVGRCDGTYLLCVMPDGGLDVVEAERVAYGHYALLAQGTGVVVGDDGVLGEVYDVLHLVTFALEALDEVALAVEDVEFLVLLAADAALCTQYVLAHQPCVSFLGLADGGAVSADGVRFFAHIVLSV